MANKKPLTNTNGLIREFGSDDSISVKYGGTGLTSMPKDSIIVGNTTDEVRTIKFNFEGNGAPGLSDDINAGYSIGSKWYDITNDIEYTCLDNTINNAIWKAQSQGSQGAQGAQGASVTGSQGAQGASVTGSQGAQGAQGASVTGSQGAQGNQGASVTGSQGAQGNQGASVTGSQGAQGASVTGSQGAQGAQGASVTGSQGAQGNQGASVTGSQGAQGAQGASVTGSQGAQGASVTGSQGAQGAQGASVTGSQGAQGNQGASVTGSQGAQGASVTGSQGAQGAQGASVTGSQGAQGAQGASVTGSQGAQGAQGASVTGSQGAQGASVTGSQGAQGAQGASVTGSQGAQGNQGKFEPTIPVDYIEFNQTANHSATTAQITWNNVDKTFDLGLIGGSILQAGQELMIYAHNQTGNTITNGTVVYITAPPSADDMLHIAVASYDNTTAYSTIAVTTTDIADGDMGYCTMIGRVRDLNTSTFADGDKLYLGLNGAITNVEAVFPNHSVEIGYCVKSDTTTGVIFVHVEKQFAVEDLYNVLITNPTQGDSFIYENNQWINRNFGNITKEATGFKNPESITVTYDTTTRKVTLSGTDISAYWRSNSVTGLTGTTWTSDAHSAGVTQNQYLYYDATGFHWDTSFPSFDLLFIAMVGYSAAGAYTGTIRECHGTMPWQSHREFHQTIGCYMSGGGDCSSYVLNSTTAANRRPDISATTLNDEDLVTINPSLTSKSYTIINLTGADTRAYTDDYTEIIPVSGSRPYVNTYTGGAWTQTLIGNNNYGCIYIIAVPRASDTLSQKRRYAFVQPQAEFTTLDLAKAYTSNNISLGTETNLISEFVFIGKIIIRYTGGDWSLISVEKLTGTKISQTSTVGNALTAVSHDSTLTGDGTATSPLSVIQYYHIHSAMMGSATGSLGYFSIHPQNINPFENALTTSGDAFNNGKLNPIIMPFAWKLSELHVAVGHCAVAQATAATTPTLRIEFFSHTGTSRTSIGSIDVPLDGTNCGVYNNLGSNNFQTVSVTGITTITGSARDMIGWQFTNRGTTNDQINAVAQVTVKVRFDKV